MDDAPFAPPDIQAAREGALVPVGRARSSAGMQYLYSYRYLFDHPNWGTTLLACSLCQLVPIVGPIVALGYQDEVIESLHRGDGAKHPAFDTSQLGYYLKRGVWPLLVALLLVLLMMPVFMVMTFGTLFGVIALAAAARDAAPAVLGVAIPLAILVQFAIALAMNMVTLPIMLRAGLSQDFGEAFRMSWTWDFIRRVWLEELLAQLFLTITAPILVVLGLALFCVGMYPATAVIQMAASHLQYQLYELYLARGGEPIPLKPPPVRVQPAIIPLSPA